MCERVGKTLDTTATWASALASCKAARNPPPPAPRIRVSNLEKKVKDLSETLEDLVGSAKNIKQLREQVKRLQMEAVNNRYKDANKNKGSKGVKTQVPLN